MSKVQVSKIKNLGTLVIRREKDSRFFYSTSDSIIISIQSLATLIKFLVFNGFISPKVLEGILSEFYDGNEELRRSKNE